VSNDAAPIVPVEAIVDSVIQLLANMIYRPLIRAMIEKASMPEDKSLPSIKRSEESTTMSPRKLTASPQRLPITSRTPDRYFIMTLGSATPPKPGVLILTIDYYST